MQKEPLSIGRSRTEAQAFLQIIMEVNYVW